jgi:hypothetical protein
VHVRRSDRADIGHFLDFRDSCLTQPVEDPEMPRQCICSGFTDVPDSEREQKPGERRLLALLQRFCEVGGGFLAHSIELGELLRSKSIKSGCVFDEGLLDELVDELAAETLDIHRAA